MDTGRHHRLIVPLTVTALTLVTLAWAGPPASAPPAWSAAVQKDRTHVVLAWNDLGMHCYNLDYKDLGLLPPYNTIWAQVVRVGDPPQFVTEGINVTYRVLDNTYSAGKTNFWTYAQQLFRLPAPLPPNVGLAGKGLTGSMDLIRDPVLGNHFRATGIPLTEFLDGKQKTPYPFQLAEITVRDVTGTVLAQTLTVAPVSSEFHCDNCHADDGDATMNSGIVPTGGVFTNVLAVHDLRNPSVSPKLMDSRPVLCSRPTCHSDNALGANGPGYSSSLSHAMHNRHKDLPDIAPDTTAGCYNCHPGPATQCLRDSMSQHFALNCTTCHGNMADVASLDREPWVTEPRCDNATCHGQGFALDQGLYRNSRGHGGTYCAGCHDSPHATAPSREYNDSIKFLLLQGDNGTLRKCVVCHATQPTTAFRHQWKTGP